MDRGQDDEFFETMDTFGIPGAKVYFDDALWTRDPKTPVVRQALQSARQAEHAGPPGRKATEALSKHLIVDMFVRNLQGTAPEEAGEWATAALRKIYGA